LGARRFRTAFIGLTVLAVGAFCAVMAGFYIMQRDLLYTPRDTANVAAPGSIAIAGSRRFDLETSDGERLAAWYFPPSRAEQPVFLFVHGRGGGLERMDGRWKRVREHGAGVLAFSMRGYPGSSGEPSEAGFAIDARTAYDWLRNSYPAERIVLHGLSLGSGVAARLATEVDAKALILEAPYTSISDMVSETYPWLPLERVLIDRFETRDLISRIRMPVLIAHGGADTIIPFRHGEELFALAKEPKQFVRMPGSDHNTLVRDGLYQHIWAYLKSLSASP